MEQLFIPYELSVIAKEKGFNESCLAGYLTNGELAPPDYELNFFRNRNRSGGEISAPLYQQVVDWLRIKHDIVLEIHATASQINSEKGFNYYIWNRTTGYEDFSEPKNCPTGEFITDNYYIALNKVIDEAFKLI